MIHIFNDANSVIVFIVGIIVSAIFLIGVWEFSRQSVIGVEGTLTVKMKKKSSASTNKKELK